MERVWLYYCSKRWEGCQKLTLHVTTMQKGLRVTVEEVTDSDSNDVRCSPEDAESEPEWVGIQNNLRMALFQTVIQIWKKGNWMSKRTKKSEILHCSSAPHSSKKLNRWQLKLRRNNGVRGRDQKNTQRSQLSHCAFKQRSIKNLLWRVINS